MKKQYRNVSLVVGSLLALSVFPASAQDGDKLRARLVGKQEVPLVSTGASGDFEASIESDTLVRFKLSYEGIEGGNILFAHIHLGRRGTNGGIMAFLCNNTAVGPQPRACPAAPATIEGTITPADITPIGPQQIPAGEAGFEEFLRALRNGTAYANLHTQASQAGEIRGQIRNGNGHHTGQDDHHDH